MIIFLFFILYINFMKLQVSLLFLSLFFICQAYADVRLPKIFNEHMVLQRHKPIPVWGWADAGEKVTVELAGSGISGKIKTIKAGRDGKWILRLDAEKEGGPYKLIVKGKKNTITLDDVLIGEVWICSGQSNMQWTVLRSDNAEEEIAAANYPLIRQFEVPREISLAPKDDLSGGKWKPATPGNVKNFTAVGYFFARELYRQLGVPVGLINTSWGGTIVETWISKEAIKSFSGFSDVVNTMPSSLEELGVKRKVKLNNTINELQGGLPTPAEVQSWSAASFDDSNWKTIELPRHFDRGNFILHDGAVWFRREFDLPDSLSGQYLVLSLGTIDGIDDTYVNGVKIGSTSVKTSTERTYIVEPSLLRVQKNSIAVRI